MKINGYKLRDALRRWHLRKDTAHGQFADSLLAFPGEIKPNPDDIAEAVLKAERAIAELQATQAAYNIRVRIRVDGVSESLSLLQCVKQVGGFERMVALWKSAAKPKKARNLYSSEPANLRGTDKVVATRTISYEDAANRAAVYDRTRAAYVEALAVGNATELDIENLDPSLFE